MAEYFCLVGRYAVLGRIDYQKQKNNVSGEESAAGA
jgi:hypothetical protein